MWNETGGKLGTTILWWTTMRTSPGEESDAVVFPNDFIGRMEPFDEAFRRRDVPRFHRLPAVDRKNTVFFRRSREFEERFCGFEFLWI